ncbi:MAG: hypothetical protein ABSA45_01055 [Verrucomicrobiota bacterium]|jgi:hypothetical protein
MTRLIILKSVMKFAFFVFSSAFLFWTAGARDALSGPTPLFPDDPKGLKLPAGVPRMVDTNGNVVWIDEDFTTRQYQKAAFKQVLQEANQVAKELQLPEKLPITETDLVEAVVTPFGYNYVNKRVGNVTTKKYCYGVSYGNKFSNLVVPNYDQICLSYERQPMPIQQINTNAAYRLATRWLKQISMDVNGLNRDCKAHVALSPFWNGLTKLGERPQKQFVPIYYVWWTSLTNDLEGYGSVASVELYAPTKMLLQLTVTEPKYNLRKPLVLTNLNFLFPGTAPVYTLPPPSKTVGELDPD